MNGVFIQKNYQDSLKPEPTSQETAENPEEMNFDLEEAGKGDQFMAVLPWLAAIVSPSNPPQNNPHPPEKSLEPDYIFGYRCGDCRDNVFYTKEENKIVYMTASIGVVLDKKNNKQKFFGCGDQKLTQNCHNDDITALSIHPNKEVIATGQVGKDPLICLWNATTMEFITSFKQGRDTRAVRSIGFSKSGKYISTTGDDNDHTVFVFDWAKSIKLCSGKSGPDAIIDQDFSTTDDHVFATAGKNGLKFWSFDSPKSFDYKKGIFGAHKMCDMTSVQYLLDGRTISGSLTGDLYVWAGNTCMKAIKAHTKAITSISCADNGTVITGGTDKILILYDKSLVQKGKIELNSSPVGIDQDINGNIIVGLRDGTIQEIIAGSINEVMVSHSDGEVWGLSICPTTGYVLTTGDDNRILVYDTVKNKCIARAIINEKRGLKPKIGGASTLSSFPPNQCARALAISKKYGYVAVGINEGTVSIRKSIDNLNVEIASLTEPKEWIEAISFSPNDEWLAVGCHDNFIYIYDTKKFKLNSVCKGHNSYITSVDWSLGSDIIFSTCGAYEMLFFDAISGKHIPGGANAFKDEEFQSFTNKLGWCVQGIFPSGTDGTHINGVDRSKNKALLSTSDDWIS